MCCITRHNSSPQQVRVDQQLKQGTNEDWGRGFISQPGLYSLHTNNMTLHFQIACSSYASPYHKLLWRADASKYSAVLRIKTTWLGLGKHHGLGLNKYVNYVS